jgi:hypothetical protein
MCTLHIHAHLPQPTHVRRPDFHTHAATDIKTLQPQEDEVKELRNHVIIAGYGRVGQIIAQMLSELLIPFVALDVRSDRCAGGAVALVVWGAGCAARQALATARHCPAAHLHPQPHTPRQTHPPL